MKFTEGTIGRVFILKFDHGDDFQAEITNFCTEKNIRAGQVQFLGAIKKSNVVVGPKTPEIPPEPVWAEFDSPHEVVGYGTIFWKGDEPAVHMHTVFSYKDKAFLGCIRKETEVFIVIEAVIIEFSGVTITREKDPTTGLALMKIK
ncbi:MAG: DUF296 domain-containing protein [Candidatus Omnitrophica bacterium]|nr:DUF296 domain-containing protein [Candidatus Omnitrophota bacterium]